MSTNVTAHKQHRIAYFLPDQDWFEHINRSELTEATQIQQSYIIAGLEAHGHTLTYISPNKLNQIVYSNNLQENKKVPLTWSRSFGFEVTSKLAWRIQQWLGIPYLNFFSNYRRYDACLQCLPGHDLVHEHNSLYNSSVAMACKKLKIPYVVFFDADQISELDYLGYPITGLLRKRAIRLLRYNLNKANCVICVSEASKEHLINAYQIQSDKIVVFPNAVDIEMFKPSPQISAEVRTSLGKNNNPLLIFVGNFYKWHDLRTLVDGFSQVLIDFPNASLLLVGDGLTRPTVESNVDSMGIGHAVRFMGSLDHQEIPRLLSAADIAIAPVIAMDKNFRLSPMKLFEYMASEVAVIASAVGQPATIIQNERNGLLIPPEDSQAMAVAINRLISNPTLRIKLAKQARKDIIEKYSWEHYILRLEQLYSKVIAHQKYSI